MDTHKVASSSSRKCLVRAEVSGYRLEAKHWENRQKPTLLQLDGVSLMVVGSKEDLFLEISVTLHLLLVVYSFNSTSITIHLLQEANL